MNKMRKNTASKKDEQLIRAFRVNIRSLLKKFDFKVYDLKLFDLFVRFYFKDRKFPFVGATNVNNLNQLKQGLLALHLKVTGIDTLHYQGLYFEASPTLIGLIISAKNEYVSIDQKIQNQHRETELVQELQSFGKKNNLENLILLDLPSAILLWMGDARVVAETFGISWQQLHLLKFINSHKEFKSNYFDYKNGKNRFVLSDQYNNIEMFSWIYYWEIKVIAEHLKDQSISIHDAGACNAHFPLLLSGLSPKELFGINISKIIASDKIWSSKNIVKKVIKINPKYKPIEFITLDLVKETHKAPVTDVIILNDVLEHLPNDELSLSTLKKLWEKTGKLLIAHVPFESIPNPAWDHHITFDADKIKDWAGQLPGANFLSDIYYDDEKNTLTTQGYLIVAK